MAYDDDRDNPPNDRITIADLLRPFGAKRAAKKRQTARNTVDREYQCIEAADQLVALGAADSVAAALIEASQGGVTQNEARRCASWSPGPGQIRHTVPSGRP